MLLSEAIRTGARLRPQAFGGLFCPVIHGGPLGSCALGAAAEATYGSVAAALAAAAGLPRANPEPWGLLDRYPLLAEWDPPLPCGCSLEKVGPLSVDAAITHLNDFHSWPRERIAKWVAMLERK